MATQTLISHPLLTRWNIVNRTVLREMIAGFLLVAIFAQIVIPFHPIPLTGQTLAVVLVGMLAHRNSAASALTLYATLAAFGAPILSGGTSGIGASFGFVLGFIGAAYAVAHLAQRGLSGWRAIAVPAIGLAIPYIPGLIWLTGFLSLNGRFSFSTLLETGITPFLIGDASKLLIASIFALLISEKQAHQS
ncbi:biotin transporter BioY [Arcanobacterium hippocoleae]|uniref:biotin transporter BioY n=1 Tax=Arcanobacterium hippocoleae TaxID=149017 RepID=UPI00333F0A08